MASTRFGNGMCAPGVPANVQGHGKPVVVTEDLRRVLAPAIEQMERNRRVEHHLHEDEATGVLGDVAMWAAHSRGQGEEAGIRRLFNVLNEDGYTTIIDWADAFILAVGRHIGNEPIPVLPGSGQSALEMVAALSDYGDEKISLPEQVKLARSLFNFSRGYIAAERALDEIPAGLEAARAVGAFLQAFAPEREALAVAA
jgi:hypothetical protein